MPQRRNPGTSLWEAVPTVTAQPALPEDRQAGVCVVGAGIAGLSTAYLLAREGRSVIVLDAGPGGGGETRYTTAHLASALDDRHCEVEHVRGAAVRAPCCAAG
jgi:cation diffusion facilitator CzcD-associated flavoprotein CzcO